MTLHVCCLSACLYIRFLPYRRGAIRIRARRLRGRSAAPGPRGPNSSGLFASPPAPWCVPYAPWLADARLLWSSGGSSSSTPSRPAAAGPRVSWRRYARSHATSARGSSPRDGGGWGLDRPLTVSAPARVEVGKLNGTAPSRGSVLDELDERCPTRACPREVNARFLSADPDHTSLAEIRLRARHAHHLDRKVLTDVQEERKPRQAQALGAHIRDPAHQPGSVRAAHAGRHIDRKPLLDTPRRPQVLDDCWKARHRKFEPASDEVRALRRPHSSSCEAGYVRAGNRELHEDPVPVAVGKLCWEEEQAPPFDLVEVQRHIRGRTELVPEERNRHLSGFRLAGVDHGHSVPVEGLDW